MPARTVIEPVRINGHRHASPALSLVASVTGGHHAALVDYASPPAEQPGRAASASASARRCCLWEATDGACCEGGALICANAGPDLVVTPFFVRGERNRTPAAMTRFMIAIILGGLLLAFIGSVALAAQRVVAYQAYLVAEARV